jgi:hypothetical protein
MMEAARTYETLANFYQTTRRYNPEDSHLCTSVFCVQPELFLKMAVFWVVGLCNLVEVYRRFRGACCLHHQGDEAASTSATSVDLYQTTWRNNPEDSRLRTHRRENLKSHLEWFLLSLVACC